MSKNKKSFSKPRNNFNPVDVIDIDTLSYSNDDDLIRRLDHLFNEKDKVNQSNMDSVAWEVEICYVQRELRIRNGRKAAHEKYLREHKSEFQEEMILN